MQSKLKLQMNWASHYLGKFNPLTHASFGSTPLEMGKSRE